MLVGVDDRQGGRDAIALAKQLSGSKTTLTLAHVCVAHLAAGGAATLLLESEQRRAHELLEARGDEAGVRARLAIHTETSVAAGLHESAVEHHADLIVVGSCHRGPLGRLLAGDDARATLRGAPCPIAVAPAGYGPSGGDIYRIGVGFDGSPESRRAVEVAEALAHERGAITKVMSVVAAMEAPEAWVHTIPYGELDDREHDPGERTYGFVDPGSELVRFTGEVDLLIVGSRNEGRLARLLNGSVSDYLVRRSRCPVIVLPRGVKTRSHQNRLPRDAATRDP